MQISLFNAWLLSAPIAIIGIDIAVFHRETAKRMADMTGYSRKDKAATISASVAPYPFMFLTIFIPPSSNKVAAVIGALLYAVGLIGFVVAVVNYIKTLPGVLTTNGIYKVSRNPMYVTALLAFTGIAVITLNVLLTILLIIMILLHHMMILSEEKVCAKRFGQQYKQYTGNTPRYLFL